MVARNNKATFYPAHKPTFHADGLFSNRLVVTFEVDDLEAAADEVYLSMQQEHHSQRRLLCPSNKP